MSNLLTTTVIGSYTVPDWYPALQEAVMVGKLAPEAFSDAKAIVSAPRPWLGQDAATR